jgi:hypothetical protein
MAEWTDDFGNKLINVHEELTCMGPSCPIHAPSNHPMRAFPQQWSLTKYYMERICFHNIAHPDPDDYKATAVWREHNCDGCCKGPSRQD